MVFSGHGNCHHLAKIVVTSRELPRKLSPVLPSMALSVPKCFHVVMDGGGLAAGVQGQDASGGLWSHCVSWADLTVPVGVDHGAVRLELGEGWPDRWSVSWKIGKRAESRAVREVAQAPLAGADPIRAFSWRRGQRHRPGLEYLVSTGRHHGFESMEEARTLLALDFAGDLADVVSQPLRLRFGAGGKWRVHTPDFLAVTRLGAWLIDVRPEHLIKEPDAESFAAAAEVALACGWRYTVVGRWRVNVWVPTTTSASCDQAILVDHATNASLSSYAVSFKIDRFG